MTLDREAPHRGLGGTGVTIPKGAELAAART